MDLRPELAVPIVPTKGKDERMVGYIKHNFFVRYRKFESLDEMNRMALMWA